jgi:hypothetical protein
MRIEELLYIKGYRINKEGIVVNPKGITVTGYIYKGYRYSGIRVEGKRKNYKFHRLQAFQKYGKKLFEEGIVTRHKDGNPLNNSWDNILIGTNSDNMMDIPKEVRMRKALHATSFVRKYDKQKVVEFYNKTKSYKKTLEHFNISSKGTLHYILNTTYPHENNN